MNYVEHRGTARVLAILKLLAQEEDGCTLSEIARILEAPKGSLHPILRTMKEEKFIRLRENSGKYQIGVMAYQTGAAFANQKGGIKYIEAKLTELVSKCLETVHFAVLEEGNVVYLLKKESPQAIRMTATVGKTMPAYGTGIGKALLLDHSLQELEELYPAGLKALTSHTIKNCKLLHEELILCRKTDMTFEKEESNADVECIGTALRKGGSIVAGISAAIPIFRSSAEKREDIRALLRQTKQELEEYLVSENIF